MEDMSNRNEKGQFIKGLNPWNKNKVGIMPTPWNKDLTKYDDYRILNYSKKVSDTLKKRISNQSGKNNYNWKGGKVDVICHSCGKHIKRHPSRNKKINFCSNKCVAEYNKVKQKGENHSNWSGGFPKCLECGIKLKDYRSTYCIFCARKGNRGANWQGGKSFELYGIEWNEELREKIRKRDNYTCQECGYTQDELGYKLHVHHIDYNKKNNNQENLISFCNSCHSQTGFKRADWTNYLQNKLKKYAN